MNVFQPNIDGGHMTDDPDCWCGPEILQPCPECIEKADDKPNPDCFRCEGRGLVDEYDEDMPSLIVHRELLTDDEKAEEGVNDPVS